MKNWWKISVILRLGIYLLVACSNSKPNPSTENSEPLPHGQITIIFKNIEEISSGFFIAPQLWCYNGYHSETINLPSINFITDDENVVDTFRIDLYAPHTLVNYSHADHYSYLYYMQPNDTLWIEFDEECPIASSSNKKLKDMDLNGLSSFKENKIQEKLLKKYILDFYSMIYIENYTKDQLRLKYKEIFQDQIIYLDSLAQQGEMTDEVFNLVRNELSLKLKRFKNDIQEIDAIKDEKEVLPSYYKLANNYVLQQFGEQNEYQSSLMFEGLIKDTIIPHKTKLSLLFNLLRKIAAEPNQEVFEAKSKQFLELSTDTLWHHWILNTQTPQS